MRIYKTYASIAAGMLALCLGSAAPAQEYALSTNLSLTGPWANYGLGMHNSFKLAIDLANASGALGPIKLRVVAGDNAGNATQAVVEDAGQVQLLFEGLAERRYAVELEREPHAETPEIAR